MWYELLRMEGRLQDCTDLGNVKGLTDEAVEEVVHEAVLHCLGVTVIISRDDDNFYFRVVLPDEVCQFQAINIRQFNVQKYYSDMGMQLFEQLKPLFSAGYGACLATRQHQEVFERPAHIRLVINNKYLWFFRHRVFLKRLRRKGEMEKKRYISIIFSQ